MNTNKIPDTYLGFGLASIHRCTHYNAVYTEMPAMICIHRTCSSNSDSMVSVAAISPILTF
jgi:hypothetical protein